MSRQLALGVLTHSVLPKNLMFKPKFEVTTIANVKRILYNTATRSEKETHASFCNSEETKKSTRSGRASCDEAMALSTCTT